MKIRLWVWILLAFASVVLLAGAYTKYLPLAPMEVWGFITGAVCVLFVVEQNIWNFPVGIANNIVFIALFLSSGLYGDMGLQVIYVALGIHGWYEWLRGGMNHSVLYVSRMQLKEGIVLAGIGCMATWGLTKYLITIHDSAPFLDALTTVLSLIAQYLLNWKRLENWYVWIIADLIYVGLYAYKHLYLTSILYALFIIMCLSGLAAWKRSQQQYDATIISEAVA